MENNDMVCSGIRSAVDVYILGNIERREGAEPCDGVVCRLPLRSGFDGPSNHA